MTEPWDCSCKPFYRRHTNECWARLARRSAAAITELRQRLAALESVGYCVDCGAKLHDGPCRHIRQADQPAPTETATRAFDLCPHCEKPLHFGACEAEPEPEPQVAPLKCEYHPIYRECVRCGGAMSRSDDLECPEGAPQPAAPRSVEQKPQEQ